MFIWGSWKLLLNLCVDRMGWFAELFFCQTQLQLRSKLAYGWVRSWQLNIFVWCRLHFWSCTHFWSCPHFWGCFYFGVIFIIGVVFHFGGILTVESNLGHIYLLGGLFFQVVFIICISFNFYFVSLFWAIFIIGFLFLNCQLLSCRVVPHKKTE